MAVPTGEYDATAKVDLSPVLGAIENRISVEIRQPEGDVLAERLGQLRSEDPEVRLRAAIDLRYFPEDAAEVVSALLGNLGDESGIVRSLALSILPAYPEEAGRHVDLYLKILTGGGGTTGGERLGAARLLGLTAPIDTKYGEALESALEGASKSFRSSYEAALTMYRRRSEAASEEKE